MSGILQQIWERENQGEDVSTRIDDLIKTHTHRYSLAEIIELMAGYEKFATASATAYYDREIVLPSSKEWIEQNK